MYVVELRIVRLHQKQTMLSVYCLYLELLSHSWVLLLPSSLCCSSSEFIVISHTAMIYEIHCSCFNSLYTELFTNEMPPSFIFSYVLQCFNASSILGWSATNISKGWMCDSLYIHPFFHSGDCHVDGS